MKCKIKPIFWLISLTRLYLMVLKTRGKLLFSIQIVKNADDFSSKFNLNTWTNYLDGKDMGNIDFTYQQDKTEDNFVPYISTVLAAAGKKSWFKSSPQT